MFLENNTLSQKYGKTVASPQGFKGPALDQIRISAFLGPCFEISELENLSAQKSRTPRFNLRCRFEAPHEVVAQVQTLEEVAVEGVVDLELEEVRMVPIVIVQSWQLICSIGRGGFQRDNGPPSAVLGRQILFRHLD